MVTGFKLTSPALFRQLWREGRYQFLLFLLTLVPIVFTDLLIGILIGLFASALFILNSNLRRPIRHIVETHLGGDAVHIELANQVSFLNRVALDKLIARAEQGSHLPIDATHTDYIDPDVLSLIRDFNNNRGPVHGVVVSLRGFRQKYDTCMTISNSTTTRRMICKIVLRLIRCSKYFAKATDASNQAIGLRGTSVARSVRLPVASLRLPRFLVASTRTFQPNWSSSWASGIYSAFALQVTLSAASRLAGLSTAWSLLA